MDLVLCSVLGGLKTCLGYNEVAVFCVVGEIIDFVTSLTDFEVVVFICSPEGLLLNRLFFLSSENSFLRAAIMFSISVVSSSSLL